jgi:hypothetical protein
MFLQNKGDLNLLNLSMTGHKVGHHNFLSGSHPVLSISVQPIVQRNHPP